MENTLLEINDLYAGTEEKEILKGLNLKINKGEVHVIMGPNGAGKSTLANVIFNNPVYIKKNGSVKFEGENINDLSTDKIAKKGVFMSFQLPEEIPGISVTNFLKFAKNKITDKPIKVFAFREQLENYMKELNMNPKLVDRNLNVGFSGGEKKKNEILQMLVLEPKLAILDETDSGLDVDAIRTVSKGINMYHTSENAVLIITHNTRILKSLTVDYVHILVDGKIVKTGDAKLAEEIDKDGYAKFKRKKNKKMKKKTQVKDIDRNIYDIKNKDNYDFKMEKGINEEIVREISKRKNEPEWMLEIRLKALEEYNKLELPTWGPDLSDLNMEEIATYVKPKSKMSSNWEEVPEDIKNTFERLGIPEAEKKSLAGVGAQYDSEVVYHNIKDELLKQGVIYTDMETAVEKYPQIVKEHFMKCVPINDHKFVALHAAVWSGGSFVYVPKNVKLDVPLQSYFRLNSPESGQFEHTLIIVEEGASLHFIEGCSAPKYNKVNLHAGCVELYVKDNAYLRYSTIENWSKNMMNLNTKKAIIGKNAQVDWVTGSFGSKVSMLYPMSILNGEGAKTEYTGITFAGKGQNLDTGFKVIHNAKNTSSVINAKSISKDGGACTYRSLVRVTKNASKSKCSVSCESLMLDDKSLSDTVPVNDIETDDVEFSHEAKIGKISDKEIFYLMTRGLSEEDAKAMIVRGFAYPISSELPVEYAVEMNNLINLELEGAIG